MLLSMTTITALDILPRPASTGFVLLAPPTIYLGTSAFTAAGWDGSFYLAGMKSRDYLSFYAEHFKTVEVDSTFYRCPSPATMNESSNKALEKDRKLRYQTGSDLRADLQRPKRDTDSGRSAVTSSAAVASSAETARQGHFRFAVSRGTNSSQRLSARRSNRGSDRCR